MLLISIVLGLIVFALVVLGVYFLINIRYFLQI